MTIINKEGKFFGKVSIIDVLVIIAIIIIGIGFYFRFFADSRAATTAVEIEYVIRVHSVRPASIGALERVELIQGQISDSRTEEEFGRIIRVEPEATFWEGALIDGSWISDPVPNRYDAIVTIRVDGRMNDMGYFTFQNRQLTVGSHITFHSKYADTSGEILEIRIVDGNVEEEIEEDIGDVYDGEIGEYVGGDVGYNGYGEYE